MHPDKTSGAVVLACKCKNDRSFFCYYRCRAPPSVLEFATSHQRLATQMAELFEVQKAAISKHLKNIFESGELLEESVVSKMETTAADGKRYNTNYYNLDAIIAVGYRVNSRKATMFRIWANRVLKASNITTNK